MACPQAEPAPEDRHETTPARNRSHCRFPRPRRLRDIARLALGALVALYEHKVKTIIAAAGPPESLYDEGTHAFDEPSNIGPMRHDPTLADEAIRRFAAFLEDVSPNL